MATVSDDENDYIIELFHDIIEDVFPRNPEFSLQRICDEFGEDVAHGVLDLTDQYTKENYPDWNRRVRKDKEATRLGKTRARSQTGKVADMIDNGSDILVNDPKFAMTYLKEMGFLLLHLTQANGHLLKLAHAIVKKGLARF